MKIRITLILLFIVALIFSFSAINTSYGADPDLPGWQVGNWWRFNIEISGDINLIGTITYTVVSDNIDVFQNGQDFNCYQIDVLAGGTIYGDSEGNGIGGTWTATERHYYMKSDQSWVAFYSTYEETISIIDDSGVTPISLVQDEITSKSTFETTYNPPFESNKGFPVTVGKSWSVATTETTMIQTTINGNSETTTESEAYTKTFLVMRKESIMLSIGETETFVIKRTDPDGVYAETYFSPEIGFDVKQIEYDASGTLQVSMELINYQYQLSGDDSHLLTTEIFTILIFVLIIMISAIVTIYLLKKKKTDIKSQTNDTLMVEQLEFFRN